MLHSLYFKAYCHILKVKFALGICTNKKMTKRNRLRNRKQHHWHFTLVTATKAQSQIDPWPGEFALENIHIFISKPDLDLFFNRNRNFVSFVCDSLHWNVFLKMALGWTNRFPLKIRSQNFATEIVVKTSRAELILACELFNLKPRKKLLDLIP